MHLKAIGGPSAAVAPGYLATVAAAAEDARQLEASTAQQLLDAAREEAISCALDRDRERTQANEWLVQLHDAKKELVRATSILEAIRTVTEELGFEMPEDLF